MVIKRILFIFIFFMASIANASDINELCLFVNGNKSRLPVEAIETISQRFEQDFVLWSVLQSSCQKVKLKYRLGPIHFYETRSPNITFFFQKDPKKRVKNLGYIKSKQKFQLQQVEIKSKKIGLQTFAFTPKEKNNGTTILMRTPYFLFEGGYGIKNAVELVDLGFNVVIQPVRGSYLNDGEFDWLNWKEERDDAKVTIDWIIKNEWSNGKVILEGVSYPGFTALAGAASNHPAIIGVFAASAPTDKYMHSLSAGNNFLFTADYVTSVNSHGDTDFMSYDNLQNFQKEYGSKILEKYEQVVGLNPLEGLRKFAKLVQSEKVPESNKELFDELKKVNFPIVHSFGIHNDQDSIDSFQNYKKLENAKNNYLFMHNKEHSDFINRALIYNYAQREQSQNSLEESIKEFFKNENVCLNKNKNKFNSNEIICSSTIKQFNEDFQDNINFNMKKNEYIFFPDRESTITGPVQLHITHKPRTQRDGLYLTLITLDRKKKEMKYLATAPLIPVSETESYVITNSIHHQLSENNPIRYKVVDQFYNSIPEDKINIKNVEVELQAMKDDQ